ncbi:hypothetical protein [Flavobacterium covae]|uniref:hypothetical protein n=1 Tax=Flavobacterium covae TaxID=2906076 RepID=UPI00339529AF
MDSQNWFAIINILTTIFVGVILARQIKSQKAIIDSYKDFVSVINPTVALQLKDTEIQQIKKNMSNDIETLQTQNTELSLYVNHIIKFLEDTYKEVEVDFDRDSFITDTLPSCRNLLNNHKEL